RSPARRAATMIATSVAGLAVQLPASCRFMGCPLGPRNLPLPHPAFVRLVKPNGHLGASAGAQKKRGFPERNPRGKRSENRPVRSAGDRIVRLAAPMGSVAPVAAPGPAPPIPRAFRAVAL